MLAKRFLMDSKLPLRIQTNSILQLSKHVWSEESDGLNFVYSPLSINLALGLLTSGSNGSTLKQMLSFLKTDSLEHTNSVSSQLIESITQTGINQGGPKLSFISGVWVQNSYTLKPLFKEIMNSVYRGEAEAVDFKTKASEVKEKVNKWAEKETNGLIKDLLPHGSIDHETRLVLANALYFKGAWDQKFDLSRTKNYDFHLLNGRGSVQVPFMTSDDKQLVSCYKGFRVLQLPYEQGADDNDGADDSDRADDNDYSDQRDISMYIFLPDERDGLGDLIQKVSSDSSFLDRHIPNTEVTLRKFRIPKFKISFGFEASRVLKELGIVLPFDENKAEFYEMVDRLDGENKLWVSGVHHKCFVQVDEIGTEAAAATAITLLGCSMSMDPMDPIDFVADHPFMFFIRDNLNGAVLFMGHVLNPLLVADD